jgi:hypothetical protein
MAEMAERPDEERSILVRVCVTDPVPGCAYGLQRRDGSVDQIQVGAVVALQFTTSVTLRLTADSTRDPRGLHVHGPRHGRFLYINSGTLAGQPGSCWTRRAKVPLLGIDAAVPLALEAMPPLIETTVAGRAKDGGPVCASVRLLIPWRHAP